MRKLICAKINLLIKDKTKRIQDLNFIVLTINITPKVEKDNQINIIVPFLSRHFDMQVHYLDLGFKKNIVCAKIDLCKKYSFGIAQELISAKKN